MKSHPTVIQYPPHNKEEEDKWGFEVYKPTGTPKAYILDWPSVGPGWGISWERVEEVASFKKGAVSEDLSKLTVDETYAVLARQMKFQWHNTLQQAEKLFGEAKALDLARAMGDECGIKGWTAVKNRFGEHVEPGPMAWYQDIAHMLYGPDTHAYCWFDDVKAVCSRPRCAFRPAKGNEHCAKYCVAFDYAYIEAYMRVDTKLLTFMAPHLGNDGCQGKCVHIWTYDPDECSAVADEVKAILPESIREILKSRGMKF